MSQTWVFRKDDYDKIIHKLKVLTDKVEELEKQNKKLSSAAEGDLDTNKRMDTDLVLK